MSHDGGGEFVEPKQASAVRKGTYCMLKDHPCKIVDMSTSKTGTHGHAKVKLTGGCALTDKKFQELFSSTHNGWFPHVTKTEYQIADIDGDAMSCMDADFAEVEITCPAESELAGLRAAYENAVAAEKDFMVTVLRAPFDGEMRERVVEFKAVAV